MSSPRPLRLPAVVLVTIVVTMLAAVLPALAATPPLVPFDVTGDLIVPEKDCDCLLAISPDGTVSILVTELEIDTLIGETNDLDDTGIAVDGDGNIWFTEDDADVLIKRSRDGTLEIVTTEAQFEAAGDGGEPSGVAIAPDGTIYVLDEGDEGDGQLVTVDPTTGDVTLVVSDADLSALPGILDAGVEEGIVTDALGNVYLASDNQPDAVFKVTPDGTPSVFSVGLGTDLSTLGNEVHTIFTDATTGTFTLEVFVDTDPSDVTAPIAYDATAADVETALEALAGVDDVTVTGSGTLSAPWVVEFTGPAASFVEVFTDGTGGGFDGLVYLLNNRDAGYQAGVDHVVSFGTDDAGPGTVSVVVGAVPGGGAVSWPVGADAATVASAFAAEPWISADDVTVTGTGTLADPWVVTFGGIWSGEDASVDDGGSTVDVLIGTLSDADSYSDIDVAMSRRGDGILVIADDGRGDFVYAIASDGTTTELVTERDLRSVQGNDGIDLEGGLAYDGSGNLYIGEDSDDDSEAILRLVDGVLEVWVSEADILAVTGETDVDFDAQFAFRFAEADLAVAKTGPDTAVAGEQVTYDIAVSSDAGSRDRVTSFDFDDVTAGLTDVTIEVDQGTYADGVWTVDLAPGDSVTGTVTGTTDPSATGTFTNTATYAPRGGHLDDDETNNSDDHELTLTQSADLALTKTGPATIGLGDEAVYTLQVTNNGPSDAADVSVEDVLPDGLRLLAATGDGFTCANDAGTVTCDHGPLAAGASITLDVTVVTELMCAGPSVDEVTCEFDGEPVDTFDNSASVASTTTDPDPSNNAASAAADLEIEDPSQFVLADDDEVLPAAGLDRDGLLPLGAAAIALGIALLTMTDPRRGRAVAIATLYLASRRLTP